MPRRKKNTRKLSGQFKKPIQVKAKPTPPTIISAESQAKYHQQLVNWIQKDWEPANIEKLARFMKLPAEYGIDSNSPDRWFLLAWHLATEHLTGLQIHVQEKKKGARVKWDPIRQAMLYVEVRDRLNKSNSRRTLSAVLLDLSKQHHVWKNFSHKTLQNQYKLAAESDFIKVILSMEQGIGGKGRIDHLSSFYTLLERKTPEN